MTLYEELSASLDQAVKGIRGEGPLKVTRVSVVPPRQYSGREVKKIRESVHMSQKIFADYLGVSFKTVAAWESGRKDPSGCACRLLNMIELDKDIIYRYPFLSYKEESE